MRPSFLGFFEGFHFFVEQGIEGFEVVVVIAVLVVSEFVK